MAKEVIYQRNKKMINEEMSLTEVYKVYAFNNGLPVFNEKLKDDGNYYMYLQSNGEVLVKEESMTNDEFIAKNIYTLFNNKKIYVNGGLVDSYVKAKDIKSLANYFVQELENDLSIEVGQTDSETDNKILLRFGKNNALNMNVGTIEFDDKNELHVAFGRIRKAFYDIAEGLCE